MEAWAKSLKLLTATQKKKKLQIDSNNVAIF